LARLHHCANVFDYRSVAKGFSYVFYFDHFGYKVLSNMPPSPDRSSGRA
jgi:hypothetical protein